MLSVAYIAAGLEHCRVTMHVRRFVVVLVILRSTLLTLNDGCTEYCSLFCLVIYEKTFFLKYLIVNMLLGRIVCALLSCLKSCFSVQFRIFIFRALVEDVLHSWRCCSQCLWEIWLVNWHVIRFMDCLTDWLSDSYLLTDMLCWFINYCLLKIYWNYCLIILLMNCSMLF